MSIFSLEVLKAAHKQSIFNKEQILNSSICGCFHCLEIFEPIKIKEWTDKGNPKGETPLCPYCGIDSLLGSASGYPVNYLGFLKDMRKCWFNE